MKIAQKKATKDGYKNSYIILILLNLMWTLLRSLCVYNRHKANVTKKGEKKCI